jgi:hypothetical protein
MASHIGAWRHWEDSMRIDTLAILLAGFLGLAGPAQAAFESAYTDTDLADCLLLEADDFSAAWACPGYRGYPVHVVEGDLRFYIGYGFNAPDERVASQTLPPFNNLGPRMEWRLSNASGRWMPVATIVRYVTDNADDIEGPNGEVLVVSQIEPGNSCHIAYIDARANSDANALARAAADRLAGTVECEGHEPEIIGRFTAY